VGPWRSLVTSWQAGFGHGYGAEFAFMEQLELVAVLGMAAAAVVFAARRRWPEALYVGLAAAALGTSTWYQSGPRSLLLAFPLWIALARAAERRRWVGAAYLWVSAPTAAVVATMYLSGQWSG
jgi:hypothetical protein